MIKRALCLPFLAALLMVATSRTVGGMSIPAAEILSKALQSRLDAFIASRAVPGVTFSLRRADGTNTSLSSGLADLEEGAPMLPDAVMFSGSVGKTYAAAIILKLHERGQVDLHARAADYLRDEAWFPRIANAGEITVEMLLNHTAGVPEYVYKKEIWQELRRNPDRTWSVGERLSFIAGNPPPHPAGKGWAYADSHYLILGRIIEKVTGRSYYDVLYEMVLKPCCLDRTRPADRRALAGLVAGYTRLTEDLLLPRKVSGNGAYAFNPQLEWTGGGLVTTVSDLTSWARQLYGGAVLKPATRKRMLTPAPFPTTLAENAGYGLGTFIGENDGTAYYGHSGFVPGFLTILQYLPRCGSALALQVNSDDLRGQDSLLRLFNDLKHIVLEHEPGGGNDAERGRSPWSCCAGTAKE
jgi:D-alanyl-D-alanine carboxypeptidase